MAPNLGARLILLSLTAQAVARASIDRASVIRSFNPQRNTSSNSTPIQVGNGDLAFGADITGLQTFLPFNILSSWCWHNSSLPTTPGQTSPADFTGVDWFTHGRLVNYAQPTPDKPEISQWLRGNPHRVNLGRIGLSFGNLIVSENDLRNRQQHLDLYTGTIFSSFTFEGFQVQIETIADPLDDSIAFSIRSALLNQGDLGVFIDYPYSSDKLQFEAPFVGVWNATWQHQTRVLHNDSSSAVVTHVQDETTYHTDIRWTTPASFGSVISSPHRYTLMPTKGDCLQFVVQFTPTIPISNVTASFATIQNRSHSSWESYWERGAFIDFTRSEDTKATELQRRVILSQYLTAVNGASRDPPQESGLTNNGWYGKFHLEMVAWHNTHWALWNHWDLFSRCTDVYKRFLPSSRERARLQGYNGARWGKMSDPSGRSAPGEINSLLIWQQPHPMFLAELEYQTFTTQKTLEKWNEVLVATADFMASYAFWNGPTVRYDIGPPMYPVSENTPPNSTLNPTFELAYWRFGLEVARDWQLRQGKSVPGAWEHVLQHLAPLAVENDTYVTYEGIPDMWGNSNWTTDHPGLIGIYGLLPPVDGVNETIVRNTLAKVYETYDLPNSYGWDFPFLAMTAARLGDAQTAVDFLTHENFDFDDVGMPIGGVRVPTPYFPMSTSLLFAVAAMAAGWKTASSGTNRWPDGWIVESEGFVQPL